MSVYLIGYDLNKSGHDYDGLYKAIQSFGSWCHVLDSTWVVWANSAQEVQARIQPHIDSNDTFFIVRITTDYVGWLPENVWEWVHKLVI